MKSLWHYLAIGILVAFGIVFVLVYATAILLGVPVLAIYMMRSGVLPVVILGPLVWIFGWGIGIGSAIWAMEKIDP